MRFLLFLLAPLVAAAAHAQDSLITVSRLPGVVWVGQVFVVTWEVSGRLNDDGELLPASGFEVLGGPYKSTSMTSHNDTVKEVASISYQLKVGEAGDLELPRLGASIGHATAMSPVVKVHALAKGAPSPAPDAMSKALFYSVPPLGQVAGYACQGGGYVTLRTEAGEEVKRFLTVQEARELEEYLSKLASKK